jgi:hypothetical protein
VGANGNGNGNGHGHDHGTPPQNAYGRLGSDQAHDH